MKLSSDWVIVISMWLCYRLHTRIVFLLKANLPHLNLLYCVELLNVYFIIVGIFDTNPQTFIELHL